MTYRIRRASDGEYRWFLAYALPEKDAQGTILHWYGTSTDIEEQKRAEELLIQANDFLRQFVTMISHEFRTTLTTIHGFSELLQEAACSDEEVKDFAHDISTDAIRLHRMLNDLLDLEKMQAGKMVLQREMIDFTALLKDVAERTFTATPYHKMVLDLEDAHPHLWLDADKLTQVLTNLFSNAIKYAPSGGEIRICSAVEGNSLHVRVEDQGLGIPAEALDEIFTPYNRIYSKKSRFVQGTGLGLAIVRQIIELHGGRVWAESTLGEGSTFHMTLPFGDHRDVHTAEDMGE